MPATLSRIAVVGLSVGAICLGLAYLLGGRDAIRGLHHGMLARSCGEATGSDERHLAWSGGDRIDIALPGNVHLRGGDGSEIVVRGAPDVIARVELRGHRLVLGCGFGGAPAIDVTLPGKAFRRIDLAGSARLDLEKVEQRELALKISGSGSVRGQGSIDRLSLRISGSGDARLADLSTRELSLKISGSGSVEAAPKDEADISISGSGSVRLLTRPAQLRTHVSGSGRITQVAEADPSRK